jgi:hypothetical protein
VPRRAMTAPGCWLVVYTGRVVGVDSGSWLLWLLGKRGCKIGTKGTCRCAGHQACSLVDLIRSGWAYSVGARLVAVFACVVESSRVCTWSTGTVVC